MRLLPRTQVISQKLFTAGAVFPPESLRARKSLREQRKSRRCAKVISRDVKVCDLRSRQAFLFVGCVLVCRRIELSESFFLYVFFRVLVIGFLSGPGV